jgi:hypothetical protein
MALETDISDALTRNLPQSVGAVLRDRLAEADKNEAALKSANGSLKKLEERLADLLRREKFDYELIERANKLGAAEAALALREATIKLREECAQLRVSDMKELTLAVFANNRFKYSSTGYESVPVMNAGYQSLQQTTRGTAVEGQG